MGSYLTILVLLVLLAAVLRDDFAFTLIYVLVGAMTVGSWWSRRALSQVKYERIYPDRAFLGEKLEVRLVITNHGWLPLPWLRVHEGLPVALSGPEALQRVVTMGSRRSTEFRYELEARKRGHYPIGPLFISSGDILGLNAELRRESEPEHLVVYPKIVPLSAVKIPSRSPQGTLRHSQPIFEDPTRVRGKREYMPGDSLRQVDWKSTAITGRMQVKLFEPSIALETVIFLNLNASDYHYRTQLDATELAIVIAASIANWVIGKGQTLGLTVNGIDPLSNEEQPLDLPPRKGKGHLMRVLENLARAEIKYEDAGFTELLRRQRHHLTWGTTLIVITGSADDALLQELYQARRSGQNTLLVLAGPVIASQEIRFRAGFYGIPVVPILNETGLDIWRR
ncbi:MAG: DUF58 domain-containing protein [Anaerolineales bacterium]|nr:DUF58 domain-containing protein [Anaerolineales bacterium]